MEDNLCSTTSVSRVDNDTIMPDKKKLPKFKLVERTDETKDTALRSTESSSTPPKKPLTLREVDASAHPQCTSNAPKLKVEQILEDAYAPDHKRLKRARRSKCLTSISIVAALFALSAYLTYAYAHVWKQWPQLEPTNWYLPFVISVVTSVAALVKSYQFLTKRHSISLMLTGICIAGGLASWNVNVLHVATQIGTSATGQGAWEPKDMTEALIAYELNTCRGINPSTYTSVSISRYQRMFKEMPRNQWKPYFQLYLSPQELNNVNVINMDKYMKIVAERMQARRSVQWAKFEALYKSPSFLFMIQQWALYPYIKVLKMI